jgi:hypothetical protein
MWSQKPRGIGGTPLPVPFSLLPPLAGGFFLRVAPLLLCQEDLITPETVSVGAQNRLCLVVWVSRRVWGHSGLCPEVGESRYSIAKDCSPSEQPGECRGQCRGQALLVATVRGVFGDDYANGGSYDGCSWTRWHAN